MTRVEDRPSSGALEEIRRLAGPPAEVLGVARLEGGQHADTEMVSGHTLSYVEEATGMVVASAPPGRVAKP